MKNVLTKSKNYGIIILVHEKRGQKRKVIKRTLTTE